MGIALNDPNPMYPTDSRGTVSLVLWTSSPQKATHVTNRSRKLLTPSPSPVVELFSWGDTTRQRWDNCRNKIYGYGNVMAERATSCGEAYTEDEAKAMKFYGARSDAFQCLSFELWNACLRASMTNANCELMELASALINLGAL